MRGIQHIKQLTFSELETVIENYPWFTIARKEYFERLLSEGDLSRKDAAKKVAVFFIDRSVLAREKVVTEEVVEPIAEEVVAPKEVIKVVYAGGDYFSREEVAAMEQSGEGFGKISFNPVSSTIDNIAQNYIPQEQIAKQVKYDDLVCTETLAQIYANQGFYSKAIEIYSKLILIYPEKNTYFATLINEIKQK